MSVYVQLGVRNLLQAPRRTFLLGAALSMVTLLLVLLMSLSEGISDTMIRSATTLSAGHVNVAGFHKVRTTDSAPIVTDAAKVRAIVEKSTPGLDLIIERQRGWARVVSETSSLQSGLTGIRYADEPRLFKVIRLAPQSEYVEGGEDEVMGKPEKLAEPGNAMIFVSQAKRLGVRVGDPLTITIETYSGARNTTDVVVVAVAKDVGFLSNWNVFLPRETVEELYRLSPSTSGAIMVYLEDPSQAEATMGHLRNVLADAGYRIMDHDPQPFWMKFETVAGEDWTGQKLDLTVWKDEVSFLTWVLRAVDSVSYFLVGILLVIIVIGIMNSMWIAVRERTNEIGTLRAIGMHRRRVLIMFMVEAVLLGLAATTVGALAGAGIALAIDAAEIQVPAAAVKAILMSDTIHLVVAPTEVIGAALTFTLVTALSALWPAMRAARLEPVTAIHKVG